MLDLIRVYIHNKRADAHESISALEIAALASTIPYEIFCGFSERVPRQYI